MIKEDTEFILANGVRIRGIRTNYDDDDPYYELMTFYEEGIYSNDGKLEESIFGNIKEIIHVKKDAVVVKITHYENKVKK